VLCQRNPIPSEEARAFFGATYIWEAIFLGMLLDHALRGVFLLFAIPSTPDHMKGLNSRWDFEVCDPPSTTWTTQLWNPFGHTRTCRQHVDFATKRSLTGLRIVRKPPRACPNQSIPSFTVIGSNRSPQVDPPSGLPVWTRILIHDRIFILRLRRLSEESWIDLGQSSEFLPHSLYLATIWYGTHDFSMYGYMAYFHLV
jgi:hypothetical protein